MIDAIWILAQTAPPAGAGAAAAPAPWYEFWLQNSVGLMLVLIFVTAIAGTIIGARTRDRCLKKFGKYDVTVLEQGGRRIWGRLKVFSNGIEIEFRPESLKEESPQKQSFLYYQNEMAGILMLYRYLEEMEESAGHRRRSQIRRMARPRLVTRMGRSVRNLANTFRDAMVKSLGVVVSQAQRTSKAAVLQVGAGNINEVGGMLLGKVGNSYEPILEQYFGDEVVAEVVNPADPAKKKVEYAGYLGEYSASYILLVNCARTEQGEIVLPADGQMRISHHLCAERQGTKLTVHHGGHFPARLVRVTWGQHDQSFNRPLAAGSSTSVDLEGEPGAGDTVHVVLETTRQFDLIAPRTVATVRHRASFAQAGPHGG